MLKMQIELDAPHAGQQRVIDEAKRWNVLQCGRRFGKSSLGQNLVIDTAIHGNPAAWFAPTYKLLSEVWRESKRLLAPARPTINEQEKRIRLPTRGVIDFWSLDQPDAGRGRKYKRVVIDEAGIVRNLESAWQEAIRPTLTDLRGDGWFLGTPKGHNFFHRLYARGQSGELDWASWRMPTSANPYISKDEIEAARRDMPPAAFNQEFMGIPAADGGNPFGLDAIAKCVTALSDAPAVAYGVDLAKSEDWTVVCGLDASGTACVLERWQSDWKQTRSRVLDIVGDIDALVDSTGVGDPIVEDMHRVRSNVRGFKFTAPSKQQLMEGLSASIHRREVGFPDGWLRHELDSFEYEYRTGGGVRYSAPAGTHDDGVCALALANQLLRNRSEVWEPEDWSRVFTRTPMGKRPTPRELLLAKVRGNKPM